MSRDSSFGKPVAALRFGGFVDTVVQDVTGVFFEKPDPAAICVAIERLGTRRWDAEAIQRHADAFSEQRFVDRLREIVS